MTLRVDEAIIPGRLLTGEPMTLSSESELDTLIVAGGPGIEAAVADPVLVEWVRGRAGRARRVASVCMATGMTPRRCR